MAQMKLLNNYIARTVCVAILLVTLLLSGLQIFILFVNQLGDLGKGDYGILSALYYVLLSMPYQVYLFFPMACLLGGLIGVGLLATHQELVVMRASGFSIMQITRAMMQVALILITIVTLIGNVYLPKLVRVANNHKALALSGNQVLHTNQGVWLRYQNNFIWIGEISPKQQLQNVYQFQFDSAHHLHMARHIEQLNFNKKQQKWQIIGGVETIFSSTHTVRKVLTKKFWELKLSPSILGISLHETDEMTFIELYQTIKSKQQSQQRYDHESLSYWQRLIQPITTTVMLILAIPFIFGPLRSSTMGSKLLIGASLGFSFHILNNFLGSASLVYQWPPILAAIGPSCCFALLGFYLMWRVK